MNKTTKKYRIVYARKSYGTDALGEKTSSGMEIYDSSKHYLGYMIWTNWRVTNRLRTIDILNTRTNEFMHERCLVRLLPPKREKFKF